MTFSLVIFVALVAALILGLVWSLRTSKSNERQDCNLELLGERGRHIVYLPHIQQALSAEDSEFLLARGSPNLARRVRGERRRVAIAYLDCLRDDFNALVRLARVIASLSPEIAIQQELQGFSRTMEFTARSSLIRMQLVCGLNSFERLGNLSEIVGGLTARVEGAIRELGEQSALALELASALDGRGANLGG